MLNRIVYLGGLLVALSGCRVASPEASAVFANSPGQKGDEASMAVILMIGDGMGISQLSAAMHTSAAPLNIEACPVVGFHKAFSSSDLVTDSAAGATAFACGVKTFNGAIGLGADTLPRPTILEQAHREGLATGMVATSTIVHATPAAFAAHQPLRILYEQIAVDIATSGVDLLIGGGKRYFDRRKADDRDLIAELQTRGYIVEDYYYGDLSQVRPNPERGFIFFTADNHPLPVNQGRSYLAYASRLAAEFLDRRGSKGFFLMVEGSQIDWACHANEGRLAVQETLDFDRAIGQVLEFAERRGNTLVIITADHETGGLAIDGDAKPGRVDTRFTTNLHTGSLVPVYAYGPGAEAFNGVYDNTDIYHKIKEALQLPSTSDPNDRNLRLEVSGAVDLDKSSEREP